MADISSLAPLIKQFMPFAQKRMGFKNPPRLFLKGDADNALNPLGRTAFYDPSESAITVYITDRHPKDILRSLSHELVHHTQNCNGDFSDAGEMGEGYAQNNPHMREMERQAYEMGNLCFRDWEDNIKHTIYYEHLHKGDTKMSFKDWKNKEIKTLVTEQWGFQMDLTKLNEDVGGAGGELTDKEAEEEETGNPYASKREKEGNLEEGDTGASKGDDSKTHKGEKDYTWKKGEDSKTDKGTHDDGSRKHDDSDTGRGKDYMNEDSGEEEGEHYRDNAMNDEEHIKAIEHHLAALKHDKDYDDEHIEEGGLADRPENNAQAKPDRGRRTNESAARREQKMRAMVRKAIKEAMK